MMNYDFLYFRTYFTFEPKGYNDICVYYIKQMREPKSRINSYNSNNLKKSIVPVIVKNSFNRLFTDCKYQRLGNKKICDLIYNRLVY
jgi:hypothetical protein